MIFRSLPFLALLAFCSLTANATERGVSSQCTKFYGKSGHPTATKILDADLMKIYDQTMPDIEQKAIEVREQGMKARDRNAEHPTIAYFRAFDEASRAHKELPGLLLKQALNRLPYLRQTHFNIVLSGGTADPWTLALQEAAHKEGVSFSILQLPGGLSTQGDRVLNSIPNFSPLAKAELERGPTLFLDDSYSNGDTARSVRTAVEENGGELSGVFVVYDSGLGNVSALYKSARGTLQAERKLDAFPEQPNSWRLRAAASLNLGIELERTLFDDKGQWILQGERLLQECEHMGIGVQFFRNGRAVTAPPEVKTKFPKLKMQESHSQPDLAIGHWGRSFNGKQNVQELNGEIKQLQLPKLETLPLQSQGLSRYGQREQPISQSLIFGHEYLDENYFLHRLSELGVLEPVYSGKKATPFTPGKVSVVDLRHADHFPTEKILSRILSGESFTQESKDVALSWEKIPARAQHEILTALAEKKKPPRSDSSYSERILHSISQLAAKSRDLRFLPILEQWREACLTTSGEREKILQFFKVEESKQRTEIYARLGREGKESVRFLRLLEEAITELKQTMPQEKANFQSRITTGQLSLEDSIYSFNAAGKPHTVEFEVKDKEGDSMAALHATIASDKEARVDYYWRNEALANGRVGTWLMKKFLEKYPVRKFSANLSEYNFEKLEEGLDAKETKEQAFTRTAFYRSCIELGFTKVGIELLGNSAEVFCEQ